MGHKIIFENLQTRTKYAYRVGDGKNRSEWFQFETSSDKAGSFAFIYLGDVQNDIKSLGSNPNRWTVVFTHYPIYSFLQGRNNEPYRNAVQPVLEKYNVDLVLAGDLYDHFTINKDKEGINSFSEGSDVAKINQRTEIPEGAVKNYSENELQKNQAKFPEK
ncbi:MAG: hypothetical protein FD181_140 [Prolixibacteraceae bacterium]|nr:MAG: hypothetical protein FD181_140 [Prolixibacteraceae bacterium]